MHLEGKSLYTILNDCCVVLEMITPRSKIDISIIITGTHSNVMP